jgi:flavin-dependent dehydrogenase
MVDLIIVGAGPAGLAAGIRARQLGLSVSLLAKRRRPAQRLGETLSPAAIPVLRQLGCWEGFVQDGHLACPGNCWSWGSPALRFHSFTRDPRGCAWHVDRAQLEARLRARALGLGAAILELAQTPRVARAERGWHVRARPAEPGLRRRIDADGRSRTGGAASTVTIALEARWLIDASGRGACVARRLGARRLVQDPQVALVSRLRAATEQSTDLTNLVEAVPDGWWYATRLPEAGLALLLFTTRARGVELARQPSSLDAQLARTRHVAARTRGCVRVGKPHLMAAASEHLEPAAGPGWLAAGDAALTYDPLASHGLAFALASGRDAADSVAAAAAGDGSARRYLMLVERARALYADARARIYRAEQRWPHAPYWRGRC